MKILIQSLLLITLAIFSSNSWATDCIPDSITLTSQTAVDDFQINFGPCDTVTGTLRIRDSDLTNLTGLNGLIAVNEGLILLRLDTLNNLNGFINITTVGSLTLNTLDGLSDISGLSNLSNITTSGLEIRNMMDLSNLDALQGLTQIDGGFNIDNIPNMTNLPVLANLNQYSGRLTIINNTGLTSLTALSSFPSGLNYVTIGNNDLLTDLTGLSAVNGSIEKLSVNNNDGLTSLNGLGVIITTTGNLFIYGNPMLSDVSALSGLTTIGNDFDFKDTLVTDMDAFVNLNNFSGNLQIYNNPNLQNIDGLSSLSGTLDRLEIKNNNVLDNIDGLMGITSTQSSVFIQDNLALVDISGLSWLQALGGTLNLYNNPMLSNCTPLVTLLDANDDFAVGPGPGSAGVPDILSSVNISGNLFNCNSIAQILDSVAIIYVDINTMAGNSCAIGQCWDNAYPNLQDALLAATSGTDIWLAQGVYYPDVGGGQSDNDRNATFNLIEGVSLYGGFVGTETDFEQRDVSANVTILSGDIDGDNSYTIVNGENGDNNTHLDGVTITAADSDSNGGGIYCGNVQFGVGISQVVFIGNIADSRGGAMYGCAHNVTHTSFVNNLSGIAGAIFSFGGNIKHSVFILNTAISAVGGAIRNSGAELRITNSKFIGNFSRIHRGGAIWSTSDVFLENSLFSGNKAGNQSNHHGGALFLNSSANAQLVNVTFTGNRAGDSGGAIGSTSSGTLMIDNSIIWNNQDRSGLGTVAASINHPNGTTIINNSLVQAFDPTGTSNLDTDPLFILDTDPTTAPTTLGNARLTEFSMAIDTGDNSVVATTVDLNGDLRIVNNTVDMGAYEFFVEELVFKNGFE